MTTSAPRRWLARAESMAVSPPPTTITLRPHLDLFAAVDAVQELGAGEHAGGFLARNAQADAAVRADADEDRFVIAADIGQRNFAADGGVALQLYAQVQDAADLTIQHLARQAVAGDAVTQHAAGLAEGFKNRDGVAAARQLIGAGKAGRAGAHDRDAFGFRFAGQACQLQVVFQAEIAHEALERVDGHRAVLLLAVAVVLAQGRADAPADGGERVAIRNLFPGQAARLFAGAAVSFRLGDGGQPSADIRPARGRCRCTAESWRRRRGRCGLMSPPAFDAALRTGFFTALNRAMGSLISDRASPLTRRRSQRLSVKWAGSHLSRI